MCNTKVKPPISDVEPPLDHAELQEMLAIAALNFAQSRSPEFYDYLKTKHPFLYQTFCEVQGES